MFLFIWSPNLLPPAERDKLLREMLDNIDKLDPELKKKLIQEVIANPTLIPVDVLIANKN
jgi:hypothetical protein